MNKVQWLVVILSFSSNFLFLIYFFNSKVLPPSQNSFLDYQYYYEELKNDYIDIVKRIQSINPLSRQTLFSNDLGFGITEDGRWKFRPQYKWINITPTFEPISCRYDVSEFTYPQFDRSMEVYQDFFILWNMKRARLTEEESIARFKGFKTGATDLALAGKRVGYTWEGNGEGFLIWQKLMTVYYDEDRALDFPHNNQMLGHYLFLRQLEAPLPRNMEDQVKYRFSHLEAGAELNILDYGSGLPRFTLGMLQILRFGTFQHKNFTINLYLGDVPMVPHESFLGCICSYFKINCLFYPIITKKFPSFKKRFFHYIHIDEVIEHIDNPLPLMRSLTDAVAERGSVYMNLLDHIPGSGHVHTDLSKFRTFMEKDLGFKQYVVDFRTRYLQMLYCREEDSQSMP